MAASGRRWAAALFLFGLLVGLPGSLAGQVVWNDLVLTGGVAFEGYQGNLSAVTVPFVDSTDRASAAVGEFGARGQLTFLNGSDRSLRLDFDGGIRQFAAAGFELRDYAPREWVGTVDLAYRNRIGSWGQLRGGLRLKGRSVEDRPPMPLFLQPGYRTVGANLGFRTVPLDGVRLDLEVRGEATDFTGVDLVPQLDLLDRRSRGMEVGAEWGGEQSLRLSGSLTGTSYPRQGSFDPEDPFRRDRTLRAGATWTTRSSFFAQVGVEGILNRSNSNRPEYDAVSFRTVLSMPLPADFSVGLYSVLTEKRYLHETEFARLVPGEEADNASLLYLTLTRPLVQSLDGAVRVGWTRAETEIGEAYFQRFGATFLLHYRP